MQANFGGGVDEGMYALLGACSFLSGVTRMTISLCVIILEITNDIDYLPPIMLAIIIAKAVADSFNVSLYLMIVEQKGMPYLPNRLTYGMAKFTDSLSAEGIMERQVVTFECVEKAGLIHHTLLNTSHNGYPVVETRADGQKHVVGLIRRNQLCELLHHKAGRSSTSTLPPEPIRVRVRVRARVRLGTQLFPLSLLAPPSSRCSPRAPAAVGPSVM